MTADVGITDGPGVPDPSPSSPHPEARACGKASDPAGQVAAGAFEGRRIRVLHLVGTMNRGGAESMLMEVVRHVDRERFDFAFLAHGRAAGAFDSELASLGVPVHHLPSLGTLGYRRYILALRRHLRSREPVDVVHSHLDWQGGAIAAAARMAGVPSVVVHSHASSWSKPDTPANRLNLAFSRLLVSIFATDAWACSRPAGEFLFDARTLGSERFRVVRNAIAVDRFGRASLAAVAATKARLGIPPGALVLGHVGSLSPVKNQAFLVGLAAQLVARGESIRLLLVGEGPGRAELERKVAAEGLSNEVVFAGSRPDVPDFLDVFDVFLFPSLSEGLGLAVVEAQAAGLPCVVSEALPVDVDMGLGLVHRRPLVRDAWITAIDAVRGTRRSDGPAIKRGIAERGYDIRDNVRVISDLYASLVARGRRSGAPR